MEKTPLDYIDLGRCFRPHDEKRAADDAAADSYLSFWGRSQMEKWPKLLGMSGVHIVLGEAGSGRTYEFKARANALCAEGREAFFLSLHKLASMEVTQVMEAVDCQRLSACLESDKEVWFFLDAVDESKLQRVSQFRDALDKFASLIKPGMGHARIFISSRVKDWLPVTDRRHVQEAFGLVAGQTVSCADSNEDEGDTQDMKPEIHVWTIAPLEKQQVKLYVEGHGVTDAASFITALDTAYAWELAARPLDVNLLVAYWQAHRRIGRLTEMFEHLITEQLKERPEKAEYERLFPLEPGKARQGAETLAAATILCRRLDFRIEDETVSNIGGLDARSCLPDDWQPAAVHALLSRPLFDAAIYGCTRFHHRGFAEYLAARWFVRLLEHECPVEEVLDLLFASSRGQWQARLSRVPIAIWLACVGTGEWVHVICQRLLDSVPEAFFRYGDPSLLPIEFKELILDAVVVRYRDREMLRFETSEVALSRMGEPALAASLIRHLGSSELSSALKTEFTKLARVARLHATVPVVLDLLRRGDDDDYFITHGLWLIEDLGTREQLEEVAEWFRMLPEIDCELCGQAIEILFPQSMTPSELVSLLTRLSDPEEASNLLCYKLLHTLERVNQSGLLTGTIEVLLPLIESPPYYDRTAVSQRYAWLGPALRVLLKNLLSASSLREAEQIAAARALWICTQEDVDHLSGFEHYQNNDKEPNPDRLTQKHPLIRQAAFWLHYNQERQRREQQEPLHIATWVWNHHLKFAAVTSVDFEWICRDLEQPTNSDRRLAALHMAMSYWRANGNKRPIKKRIATAIRGSSELNEAFIRASAPQWIGKLKYWWRSQTWNGFRNRYWWRNRWDKLTGVYWLIRNTLWLRWHLNSIRLGKMPGALDQLLRMNREGSGSHWAPKSWEKLTKRHGKIITDATQQGCVAVWKVSDPIDSESTEVRLVIVLAGLQHLWQSGTLNFGEWTSAEVEKATRYAIRELNGFSDWLPSLARQHPQPVIRVIEERIGREWTAGEGTGGIRILERLQWSKSSLGSLLAPAALTRLRAGDPPSAEGLRSVLLLLVKHSETSHTVYAALAAERIQEYDWSASQHHQWLVIWLQTDVSAALEHFDHLVSSGTINEDQATNAVISICGGMDGHFHRECLLAAPDYLRPAVTPKFIRWVYRWIRPEADIRRGSGSYTPTVRDDAQRFRGSLLGNLAGIDTPEAEIALLSLLGAPEMHSHRDYLLYLLEGQSRRIADGTPWASNTIRTFESKHQAEPLNVADLFAIGCRRLYLIKKMVEQPFDLVVRSYVRPKDNETVVRRFIAMKLSDLSQGLYSVPQEAVIREELRPDLSLERPSITGAVPVEVKLADERTLNSLLSDLEAQLVDDYLSNYVSRHGIFVVGLAGRRSNGWQHPDTRQMLTFEELIACLRQRSAELLAQSGRALGLEVIGINFREQPSSRH